jgi:hypothetical protein
LFGFWGIGVDAQFFLFCFVSFCFLFFVIFIFPSGPCSMHSEVAAAALAAVETIIDRLLPADHDPLRAALVNAGLAPTLAGAAESLARDRAAVLDVILLLLKLCGSDPSTVGKRVRAGRGVEPGSAF